MNLLKFGKSVFVGFYEALQTDVNIFLIGLSMPVLAIRKIRGAGLSILFYVLLRRVDDLAGFYFRLKSEEIAALRDSNE